MIKKLLLFLVLFFSFFSFSYSESDRDKECSDAWTLAWECIDKPNFTISVTNFTPSNDDNIKETAEATLSSFLQNIINKFMIWFWVLALLVMTIWAWYMILYNWQDDLLSKWKTIFMSGVISLFIALSAWILVKIVAYLLYS